jgi:beta-glucanase (GH16 family)
LNPANWVIDTGSAPGNSPTNTGVLSASNANFNQGILQLTLTQTQSGSVVTSTGAEVRTATKYGYGTFDWTMRAASTATAFDGPGTVMSGQISSGFIFQQDSGYTEIDCPEIEGQFPKQIEFTNWTSSSVNTEFTFNASFQPDQGWHDYKMIWSAGQVQYFVDGTLVKTITTNVPSLPAYVLMNLWGTNSTNFGGPATVGTTRYVYFKNFTYTAP